MRLANRRLTNMGSICCWCTRDAAPAWQICIGAPLLGLLGAANMLLHDPGNPYFWLGCCIFLYMFVAYFEAYQKMTIDLSPGAHVKPCDKIVITGPANGGLAGALLKSHIGEVQGRTGNLISVSFPPRAGESGEVLGGTFQVKAPLLRQCTAEEYHAQPLAQAGYTPPNMAQPQQELGYMPPTLQQPDMSRHDGMPAPKAAPAGATLAATLAELHLGQYEDALRGLGVAEVADLQDLEEADCMELGMKKIEIKRLKRSAQ
jgi:hypothetical protein